MPLPRSLSARATLLTAACALLPQAGTAQQQAQLGLGGPLQLQIAKMEFIKGGIFDADQWIGYQCIRVDLEPGQAYQITGTQLDPKSQRFLTLGMFRESDCTGKPILSTSSAAKVQTLKFLNDGGTFFVLARTNEGGVTLALDKIDARRIYNMGKGKNLGPPVRTAQAETVAPSAPVAPALAVAETTTAAPAPTPAPRPVPANFGTPAQNNLVEYAGGILPVQLGQEVHGETLNGARLAASTGATTATLKFEGRKGQQICVRGAAGAGLYPIVYMERLNKDEPRLLPDWASYPTDPTFLRTGSAMLITLPRDGTYYFYPRLHRIETAANGARTAAALHRNGEFAIKLWDATKPEPESLSDVMIAQDRPTKLNGVDYGWFALLDGQTLIFSNYFMGTYNVQPDGSVIRTDTDVRNNAQTRHIFRPTGPRSFSRTSANGSTGTLVFECDGTERWRNSEYGDNINFVTERNIGNGPEVVLEKGYVYLGEDEPRYSAASRLKYSLENYGLLPTKANVQRQLMFADNAVRSAQRDAEAARRNAAEERARNDRVWAGVLGALGKVGEYTQQYTAPPSNYSSATASSYQGFATMDQETASRASQLAAGMASGHSGPDENGERRSGGGSVSFTTGSTGRSGGRAGGSGITISSSEKPAEAKPDEQMRTVYLGCTWRNYTTFGGIENAKDAVHLSSLISSLEVKPDDYSKVVTERRKSATDTFRAQNGGKGIAFCEARDSEAQVKSYFSEAEKTHRELGFSVGQSSYRP